MDVPRIRYDPAGDYYEVLGVSPGASPAEVLHAYRAAVKKHHPDAGADPSDERIKLITQAYAVISDPVCRHYYDRARAAARGFGDVIRGEAWGREGGRRPAPTARRWRFARTVVLAVSLMFGVLLLAVMTAAVRAGRMTGPVPRGGRPWTERPALRSSKSVPDIPFGFGTPFEVAGGGPSRSGEQGLSLGPRLP